MAGSPGHATRQVPGSPGRALGTAILGA